MTAIWILCFLSILAVLAFAPRVRGARRTRAVGGGEGGGYSGNDGGGDACGGGDGGGD